MTLTWQIKLRYVVKPRASVDKRYMPILIGLQAFIDETDSK